MEGIGISGQSGKTATPMQLLQSSFRCQRCCVRLSLDGSLRNLDKESVQATMDTFRSRQAAMADSSGEQQPSAASSVSTASAPTTAAIATATTTMSASCDSDSQDFLMLPDSSGGAPASISQNLSSRLSVFERLFEFLNANCAADHPLCAECADSLMQLQSDRVRQLEEELRCMRRYLDHLQRQQQRDGDAATRSSQAADSEDAQLLSELEAEEAELRAQLESAGAELTAVRDEADAEEARRASLEAEHTDLQHAYAELKRQLFVLDDELTACRNQQAYAEAELNRLQNTSVLGAAFHIWYDSQMASIGGFRMGRPPGAQIDWAELNAGWGQCALLLQAVANRLGFTSAAYAVVPCASQSEIRVLANGRSLPLFSSQSRLFLDTAFDAGMSAYLTCLAELLAFVRDRYGKDRLAPYPVHPPRELEDSGQRFSVTRAGNKDERWTMALRLMLLDLKMLLAWMSTEPELPQPQTSAAMTVTSAAAAAAAAASAGTAASASAS